MTFRYQSGWRRSIPSWYSDKWQSNEQRARKEPAGYKEWGRREDQGTVLVTGGASASTDDGGSQGSRKKEKLCASDWDTAEKLSIIREDLWSSRKSSIGKKAAYRCQTEARSLLTCSNLSCRANVSRNLTGSFKRCWLR